MTGGREKRNLANLDLEANVEGQRLGLSVEV